MSKRRHKKGRNFWRHVLATTVVAFSVAPLNACEGRGQLFDDVLTRFDAEDELQSGGYAGQLKIEDHGGS